MIENYDNTNSEELNAIQKLAGDIFFTIYFHISPMLLAVKCKHFDILDMLYNKNYDINVAELSSGMTPLAVAVTLSFEEIVHNMIEHFHNLNLNDQLQGK